MKNFDVSLTRQLDNFGVCFFDSQHDFIVRAFDGFDEHDAREIERFMNVVVDQLRDEDSAIDSADCAKVFEVRGRFYVDKNFELENGDSLGFCSRGFKDEGVACRCAAILEMFFSDDEEVAADD